MDRNMRVTHVLLSVFLLHLRSTEERIETKPTFPTKNSSDTDGNHTQPSLHKPEHTSELTLPQPKTTPLTLLSQECLFQNYTRSSCAKVFCPPWLRCINGQCVCKLANQCPRISPGVCTLDGRNLLSLCHAQAIACRDKKPVFSHYLRFGSCEEDTFQVLLQEVSDQQVVQVKIGENKVLICVSDTWNMAAANVICRHVKKDNRGALALGKSKYMDIAHRDGGLDQVRQCIKVRCTGAEHSLAECVLYKPEPITYHTPVATVTCYTKEQGRRKCDEFICVNKKCVLWKHICDGVDDCGDNSDEMCCKGCQKGAFHCQTGVCVPQSAVGDHIRDCLGGEDETTTDTHTTQSVSGVLEDKLTPDTVFWSNPKEDVQKLRNHIETLQCGIPNLDYVYKTKEETEYRRTKRVVGGEETLPTQIQWQVGIREDEKIHCGGAYLGGCWVLTAAHCVRQKPQAFQVKFSVWNKLESLSTSDIVPVKNIIIHRGYDPRTYQNDIALIQLEELAHEKECITPNPAVRSVCLPWSPLQFPPNYTCTISGWGRNKEGQSVYVLKWANVSLIENCQSYYKERYYDGMMCAGDLEGKVDSCQGDSGGPLVCKDASGVSYVWGIVSWGEKCGEAGFPGVYTKVADYFEWIRQHTGWQAVTKYNH